MSHKSCRLCQSPNTTLISSGVFKITRCYKCEFQYIEDANKSLDDRWFDEYYSRRKNDSSTNLNEMREKQYLIDVSVVEKYIEDCSRILDVGCSYGKFLHLIGSLEKNLDCVGIDIDESAIIEAKEKFSDIASYEKKDILSVNSRDKFDIIIFRGTLQYLGEELNRSMSHLQHLLKDSGKVIVFSLPSTDSFMYELLGDKWALFHPEMSLMFNECSINVLADKHGFSIEELQYPYLEDVYSNPKEDYENVKNIILGGSDKSNPFWGSIMRVVLSKKHA